MQVKDIARALEAVAPKTLQEEWDNVGLMVGNPEAEVKKILLALTPSEDILDEAVRLGADMVVSHHPFIFKAMKNITTESALGRMVHKAIKNDVAIYSAHTNLDIAQGGVNDCLAQALGLGEVEGLVQTSAEHRFKLVVFVPEDAREKVKAAMFAAGAGAQGAYSACAWETLGMGQFQPEDGAQPFLGTCGQLEKVREVRLEVLVDAHNLDGVVNAMKEAHPYEEVAYDVFDNGSLGQTHYLGRIGTLKEATPLGAWLEQVKTILSVPVLSYVGDENTLIKKVALCGGSACEFMSAAQARGADVYLTGDMKYHDAQAAAECGMCMVDGSHFATEIFILKAVKTLLEASFRDALDVIIADNERSFIKYKV